MYLQQLEARRFRNLAAIALEPHPRFNVLAGDNGQGKTNLLEAVYLLGTLRSFRATRLDELVGFGAERAQVGAQIERRALSRRYEVEVTLAQSVSGQFATQRATKTAKVDGKPVRAAAEYFGGFNVVLFAPEDLRLLRGSPSGRRQFLDRAVWNVVPAFLKEAQAFERVLRSRNALLREGTSGELLAVYDEQFAVAGALLVSRRRRYVAELEPGFRAAFQRITQAGLPVELGYESVLSEPDSELPAELHELLRARRVRDVQAGYTTAGPHTDDLRVLLDGRPARLYASQGQLRALVLALKVAEIQHLAAVLDDAPVLLLDDVSSELDPARNRFLFDFLREIGGQVFITTTDARHVLLDADRADFRVDAGAIAPVATMSGKIE